MAYDFLDIYNKLNFLEYPLRLQYTNFIFNHGKTTNFSLRKIIKRIKKNEPIEYIFKTAEFCNYQFYVNRNVLIPRKETEKIVKTALLLIQNSDIDTIIDVGTGSGCIIISIAKSIDTRKKIDFIGVDISKSALKVAFKNLKKFNLENTVKLVHQDFQKFNFNNPNYKKILICANLPYIPPNASLPQSVKKYEPYLALYGKGKKGDGLIKKLIKIYKKNDNIKSMVLEKNHGIIKCFIKI